MFKNCSKYIKKFFKRNNEKIIYERLYSNEKNVVNRYNNFSSYVFEKILFDHSTGKILLVTDEFNNKIIFKLVVKFNSWNNEMSSLQKLKHKNIIQLLDYHNLNMIIDDYDLIKEGFKIKHYDNNNIYRIIPLKYYKNGDLYELLVKNTNFNESVSRFFLKPILEALLYAYDNNINHNDIKLENILLDDHFNPILSDFGYSKSNPLYNLTTNLSGTISYMSPEMVSSKAHNPNTSNSWAFGITLFSICFGCRPYSEPEKRTKDEEWIGAWLTAIRNKEWEKYWKSHERNNKIFCNMSPELKDLFENIFVFDFHDRFTLQEIYDHEWMHIENENVKTLTNEEVKNKILI